MKKLLLWNNSSARNEASASSSATDENEHSLHVAQDLIAGFGAGFVATALGFPLDLIKTRMQTSNQTSQKEGKSIFKTGRGIVRYEGVGGLYKGLASPLLTLSVQGSILFATFGAFKEFYQAEKGWHLGNGMAGLSCGPITGVLSTVELHIRTQMQLDNIEKQRFKNSFHCMRKIIKHHGVGTLFSGWGITTAKDCAYYSTYFFVYEGAKQTLQQSDARYVSQAAIPLAGGAAGTSAWLLSYPLDCVRAGLHGQTLKRGVTPTAVQVFQDLVKKQGIRGLFVGVTPTLVRASLVHSVRFSAYEGILWLFRKYGREREEIAEASRRSITNGIFSFRRQERNQ